MTVACRFKRLQAACGVAAAVVVLAGCQLSEGMLNASGKALTAATLSNHDVAALSGQACESMDAEQPVAAANSAYAQRLARLIQPFPAEVNGQPLNYKVYLVDQVNAWAMANGCVRVYAGLMDVMDDDEVQGVIGHEIGHVALGHSAARMRTVYATSAARDVAAASGNTTVAVLSQSVAGDLAEQVIHAQFSQANEIAADNYSFDLLSQLNLNPRGLVTGFQKIGQLSGGSKGGASSLLSTHPPSERRVENMQRRLDRGR